MDSELRRVVKPDGYRVAWMGGSVTRFVPGMLASRETALSRAKGLLGGMVLESVAGGVCDYVNQSFAGKELWMKTKEEMALWDALAADAVSRGHVAADSYRVTRGRWEDLVKARRKLVAAPQEMKCPVCNDEPSGKPLTGECWRENPPQSSSEANGYTLDYGEPAPVASELPEAVQGALDVLRRSYTEWVPPSDAVRKKAHDALKAWAREQTQPVDASAVYDEGFADGVALQKRCEAQPSAVGMTPELEMVLKAASLRCGYLLRGAQTKTKLTESRRLSTAISAVRAQAAKAQAVPGQVEVIPIGLWQLEELLKYADLAEVALRTGFHPPDFLFEPADCSLRNCIDAVKEQRDRYLAAVERGK